MLNAKKLMEMAKNRGVDLGEDVAEKALQGFAHLAIDVIEQLVKDTETKLDDLAYASVEGVAREMADKIEVKL